jgi:hypothetical protein
MLIDLARAYRVIKRLKRFLILGRECIVSSSTRRILVYIHPLYLIGLDHYI